MRTPLWTVKLMGHLLFLPGTMGIWSDNIRLVAGEQQWQIVINKRLLEFEDWRRFVSGVAGNKTSPTPYRALSLLFHTKSSYTRASNPPSLHCCQHGLQAVPGASPWGERCCLLKQTPQAQREGKGEDMSSCHASCLGGILVSYVRCSYFLFMSEVTLPLICSKHRKKDEKWMWLATDL